MRFRYRLLASLVILYILLCSLIVFYSEQHPIERIPYVIRGLL